MSRKVEVVLELEWVFLLEEIIWCQKSRALWLKEGDQSTEVFHRMANFDRRANTIEILNIYGVASFEVPIIRDHFVDFFENLLTKQKGWRLKLNSLIFDYIEPHNATWLERPF